MILKNILSSFKPSYRSVQISPRFLYGLDPLALGPSGPHDSRSKLHVRVGHGADYIVLTINSFLNCMMLGNMIMQ